MNSSSFRVTPAIALWAYAATGYRAVPGAFIDGNPFSCGCPAGVLAIAAGLEPDSDRGIIQVCNWLERKAGKAYAMAFTANFDAAPGKQPYYHERALDRERDRQGADDGREVRLAVEAAGLFRGRYEPWRKLAGCRREFWLYANKPAWIGV